MPASSEIFVGSTHEFAGALWNCDIQVAWFGQHVFVMQEPTLSYTWWTIRYIHSDSALKKYCNNNMRVCAILFLKCTYIHLYSCTIRLLALICLLNMWKVIPNSTQLCMLRRSLIQNKSYMAWHLQYTDTIQILFFWNAWSINIQVCPNFKHSWFGSICKLLHSG